MPIPDWPNYSITSSARATSIFRHAELVAADVPDAAFDLLRAGNAHAFASAREALIDYSVTLPGSKVLADAYGVNLVGIGVPKGQGGRLAYIGEFIEEAKASGLIQRAIEAADLRGVRVAPALKPRGRKEWRNFPPLHAEQDRLTGLNGNSAGQLRTATLALYSGR